MSPFEELLAAVRSNEIGRAEAALNRGSQVLARSKVDHPLKNPDGYREIYKQKLDANGNLYEQEGDSFLTIAVKKRCIEMVNLLLQKNADILAINESYLTALHYAVYTRQQDVTEILLCHAKEQGKINIVNQVDNKGFAPLHLAVLTGSPALTKLLLANGANLDAVIDGKASILGMAIASGNQEVLSILLQHEKCKKLLNASDIDGRTPLDYATELCNAGMMYALIDAGAELNLDRLMRDPNQAKKTRIAQILAEVIQTHTDTDWKELISQTIKLYMAIAAVQKDVLDFHVCYQQIFALHSNLTYKSDADKNKDLGMIYENYLEQLVAMTKDKIADVTESSLLITETYHAYKNFAELGDVAKNFTKYQDMVANIKKTYGTLVEHYGKEESLMELLKCVLSAMPKEIRAELSKDEPSRANNVASNHDLTSSPSTVFRQASPRNLPPPKADGPSTEDSATLRT